MEKHSKEETIQIDYDSLFDLGSSLLTQSSISSSIGMVITQPKGEKGTGVLEQSKIETQKKEFYALRKRLKPPKKDNELELLQKAFFEPHRRRKSSVNLSERKQTRRASFNLNSKTKAQKEDFPNRFHEFRPFLNPQSVLLETLSISSFWTKFTSYSPHTFNHPELQHLSLIYLQFNSVLSEVAHPKTRGYSAKSNNPLPFHHNFFNEFSAEGEFWDLREGFQWIHPQNAG